MMKPKIIIIPGNGDSHIETDNWYAWIRDELISKGFQVVARDMPDPIEAKANVWLPYIERELSADGNSIIIGHSSGGVAALRYLETHKLYGAVVVGVNHTYLGDSGEKLSGYYDHPWNWSQIKANSGWIEQFHSLDDPYIPIKEARFIHNKLETNYHEFDNRGHFMPAHNSINSTFPEVIEIIESRVK